jgi:hypothetical protein
MLTWYQIAKTNSSHGDKAKIESLEEGPVLPKSEKIGAGRNVRQKKQNCSQEGHGLEYHTKAAALA